MLLQYLECLDGFYGSNCNATCGNCKLGQFCDKGTGECLSGCKPHYNPPLCKGIISIFMHAHIVVSGWWCIDLYLKKTLPKNVCLNTTCEECPKWQSSQLNVRSLHSACLLSNINLLFCVCKLLTNRKLIWLSLYNFLDNRIFCFFLSYFVV